MTARCLLCNDPILVKDCDELDGLRNRKTVTALAVEMFRHIAHRHSQDEQSIVDRSEFPPTKPNNLLTLVEAASANGTLLTALSFLKCEDLEFGVEVERMKNLVLKSIEQKLPVPIVSS